MFQNRLQLTIDGELREATVIIKHEDADGDATTGDSYVAVHESGVTMGQSGCEMILYLTIADLDGSEALATVYAMVFTCDSNWSGEKLSDWYRTGNTFVGKAPVVDYVTGTQDNGGHGSFQTTGWMSLANTYEVMPGYHCEIRNGDETELYHIDSFSYELAEGLKMYPVLETWRTDSVPVIEALLADAKRLIDNKNYAGEGIDRLRAVYEKYYWLYVATGMLEYEIWPVCTVRKFSPAITELYHAINGVLVDISDLPSY